MSPRTVTTAVLVLILFASPWAYAQQDDDIALLRQEVAPNVVLLLDTSGSMMFGLPMNIVISTFFNPLLQQNDFAIIQPFTFLLGRHAIVFILRGDQVDQFTFVRLARNQSRIIT